GMADRTLCYRHVPIRLFYRESPAGLRLFVAGQQAATGSVSRRREPPVPAEAADGVFQDHRLGARGGGVRRPLSSEAAARAAAAVEPGNRGLPAPEVGPSRGKR